MTEEVALGTSTAPPTKRYFFNSYTQLLEAVSYEVGTGARVPVEVRVGGWRKAQGQRVATVVTRLEWKGAGACSPSTPSAALDTAVQSSINAGVVYAVSAGGSNSDACNASRARGRRRRRGRDDYDRRAGIHKYVSFIEGIYYSSIRAKN